MCLGSLRPAYPAGLSGYSIHSLGLSLWCCFDSRVLNTLRSHHIFMCDCSVLLVCLSCACERVRFCGMSLGNRERANRQRRQRPYLDNNELFSKLYFYETPASRIWNDRDSHGDRHPEKPPDGRKFLKWCLCRKPPTSLKRTLIRHHISESGCRAPEFEHICEVIPVPQNMSQSGMPLSGSQSPRSIVSRPRLRQAIFYLPILELQFSLMTNQHSIWSRSHKDLMILVKGLKIHTVRLNH